VRVVLDANVLVSALIAPAGPPREIVGAWIDERFELIASAGLLDELGEVLTRPRFRRWVSIDVVAEFVDGLARDAVIVADPPAQPGVTADPDDDYLIALARATQADYVVSGDRHLLDVTDPVPPVLTPREFLDLLDA
jgi:putative PIN family toxin of toxin-antitoxin system